MLLGLSLGITWHKFDLPTSCLPTATWTPKSPTKRLHSLQQTLLWHSTFSPSHSPTALQRLFLSDLHVFGFPEHRQGRLTSPPHACVCVCSTNTWAFSHTHTRGKNECWWHCLRTKNKITFLCHKYLQLQEICIPSTEQLHSPWEATVQCDSAFSFFVTTVPSQQSKHDREFLTRVGYFNSFQFNNISFTHLPQIFCQTSDKVPGKFEETTWTSVVIESIDRLKRSKLLLMMVP